MWISKIYDQLILFVVCSFKLSFTSIFQLSKFGYSNIEALEPARQFLENSKHKKLYSKCIHKFLGSQAVSDIKDGNMFSGGVKTHQLFY